MPKRATEEREVLARLEATLANLVELQEELHELLTGLTDRSRDCERCGKTFSPVRADARYCSTACRQAAYRARNHPKKMIKKSEKK